MPARLAQERHWVFNVLRSQVAAEDTRTSTCKHSGLLFALVFLPLTALPCAKVSEEWRGRGPIWRSNVVRNKKSFKILTNVIPAKTSVTFAHWDLN